jgi:replicative DNA helicase
MDNNQTYNFEAEQAILGAIIHEPSAIDRIAWVEPDDFGHPKNRTLFSYMRYLYENEMPIEIAFVADNMKAIGKSDAEIMDMIMHFTDLSQRATTAANIEKHAELLRTRALRRKVAELGAELQNPSEGEYGADTDIIAEIEKKLDAIRPKNKGGGLQHIKKTRDSFFKHMESPDDFMKTGFQSFDDWGGGYARKSLIIKAGRPWRRKNCFSFAGRSRDFGKQPRCSGYFLAGNGRQPSQNAHDCV